MALLVLFGLQLTGCDLVGENGPSTSKIELWPAKGTNGKLGYINRKGAFVIQPYYDEAHDFSCGYAVVKLNGNILFIDAEGKIQNAPTITKVGKTVMGFANNYVVVAEGENRWGVLDKNFNYVVQPIYYRLGCEIGAVASNGLVSFQYSSSDKVGFLNVKTGKVVIQPRFEYVFEFLDGYAAVAQDDEQWGIINAAGEYVIQPIYKQIYPVGNKRFAFAALDAAGKTYNWGLMDEKGNIIVRAIYPEYIGGLPGYYYPVSDLLPFVDSSEKCGYIDINGNIAIPFQYGAAYPFSEGYAVVYLNNRFLVIDKNDNIAFMLNDGEAGYMFQNGLILTYEYKDRKTTYRYRDTKGDIVYMWTE